MTRTGWIRTAWSMPGRAAHGCNSAGMRARSSASVADHVVAVLSEALANTARHALADRAQVVLRTDGHDVSLTVTDNGVGIPPGGRRSGLRNMAERAERLGGHLDVSTPDGGGATLEWRVPLPAQ